MIEEHPAALISGGAQGIGKGIAQTLLRGGWRVTEMHARVLPAHYAIVAGSALIQCV